MNRIDLHKGKLERLYIGRRMSGTEVAKEFNVCASTVYENLRRCGIPVRSYTEACGKSRNSSTIRPNISIEGRSYIAACLDCEGWISSNGKSSYKAGIGNNVKQLLQNVQSFCDGGTLHQKRDGSWYLSFGIEDMWVLFPQIIPFLIIKRKKAEEALEYVARRIK